MNLSAQDHQTFFTCDTDNGKPEYESKYSGNGHIFIFMPSLCQIESV